MAFSLLALLLVGCTDIFAPMPGHPVLMQPPAEYARWYALAEHCTGRHGDFGRVRWYEYPNTDEVRPGAMAVTWHDEHKIAIAGEWLHDSATVIHESMHDVLQTDEHPAKYFGVRQPFWKGGACSRYITPPYVSPAFHDGMIGHLLRPWG